MVPDVIGPDDRDRAGLAHPQAVGLGPLDPAVLAEAELGEAALEKFPRFEPAFAARAFGLGLVAAQEDVPPGGVAAEIVEHPRRERDRFGRIARQGLAAL